MLTDDIQSPPLKILQYFEKVAAIPRCTKNEAQIRTWLVQWAGEQGLRARVDATGNLMIEVPATPGYEGAPVVVLQGHLDMVCEKTPDSEHDFTRDPIRLIVDGDWLHADRTTLGADNGIAIAICLALAADQTLAHPPLELLFTIEEEIGLTGANHLDLGMVSGKLLVNIDSEQEGVFTIGCAGGKTTHLSQPLAFTAVPQETSFYRLAVSGLRGGHSGVDIHKHRANANKILVRALYRLKQVSTLRLVALQGGSAHNAIARQAYALLSCPSQDFPALQEAVQAFARQVQQEYAAREPNLALELVQVVPGEAEQLAVSEVDTRRIIDLGMALPHGVAEMSAEIEGFVETSNNLAIVEIKNQELHIVTSQRSSVMSRLAELTGRVEAIAALAGVAVRHTDGYPAWQPNLDSPLLKRSLQIYREVFRSEPVVETIHAGLECGVLGMKFHDMDMISTGATLVDPHSPSERLYIPSLEKVWTFLVALLESFH